MMERALRRVCEWGDHHGLAFNSDKTTTVMSCFTVVESLSTPQNYVWGEGAYNTLIR